MTFLDTHVLVWLYQKDLSRFPKQILERLEDEDLFVSPMVLLEMTCLCEIGRVRVTSAEIFSYLYHSIQLREDNAAFPAVVARAHQLTWTRDPFDRLIVAQAEVNAATLITGDEGIRANYTRAVW